MYEDVVENPTLIFDLHVEGIDQIFCLSELSLVYVNFTRQFKLFSWPTESQNVVLAQVNLSVPLKVKKQ